MTGDWQSLRPLVQAVLHAHLLYFCPDILKSAEDPPSITFPADGVAITEIPPLWDTTDSAGADAVWAEVPIRFNRPVDQMLPVSGLDGGG